jgi:nucleoid-associated protein YgaU
MGLAKAIIKVEERPDLEFKVQFNPEEYTINQDNNVANQAIPGLSAPQLQFVSGNMRTLEAELLFDTYDTDKLQKEDVRNLTNRFIKLMEIDPELHAPPILRFVWAELDFRCVLARASQKFIMFWNDGTPVRARITATFNEYVDLEREAKKINRQSADVTKVHTVMEGETLVSIAARRYENPQLWRPIAIANDLDDPLALRTGQSLRIPSLPFTDPASGEVVQ